MLSSILYVLIKLNKKQNISCTFLVITQFSNQVLCSAVTLDDAGECSLWADYELHEPITNSISDDDTVMYYAYSTCINIG